MKITEQLNIGGFAFNVEEDAASEIKKYLDGIRAAYEEDSSKEEICSDIEERIGELLAEKASSERIVTMSMVDYVKSVMGDFEKEPEAAGVAEPVRKRLYRDLDTRFLGGVFSGLSIYTNRDVVLYRLAYSAVCISAVVLDKGWSGTVLGLMILAYLAMWICVPAARTVEEKCRLAGKPVSAGDFSRAKTGQGKSREPEAGKSPAVKAVGRILLVLLGIWLIISGSTHLIGCGCVDMIINVVRTAVDDAEALNIMETMFSSKVLVSLLISIILLSMWKIYAGALLVFNLKAPKWRPGLVLIGAFMVSALVFTFFAARAALAIPGICG